MTKSWYHEFTCKSLINGQVQLDQPLLYQLLRLVVVINKNHI